MKKAFLSIMLLAMYIISMGQQHTCGSDAIHQNLMLANPQYASQINQQKTNWTNFINSGNNNLVVINGMDTTYEIPCVVHIIHTGGVIGSTYNPSDADVQAMITTFNKIYDATISSWPGVSNGGVNMKVKLVLAKRSPSCGSTTAINRIDGSILSGYTANGVGHATSSGPSDVTVKNLSRWNNDNYYNIWIVNKIDGFDGFSGGGVAGYAYFPGAPSNVDGTVMLAKYVNNDPQDVAVMAHEFGHAMGLYHTFEGDNGGSSCPTETNCVTQNDEVCDTDPHIRSFGCPSGTNPCTGTGYNNVQFNHMNYTNCVNRFTIGQKTKAIFNLVTMRNNLIHSQAGVPLPTTPIATATCIPTTTSSNNNQNIGPRDVILGDINHESSGYTGDGFVAYVDNSCVQSTKLKSGQTYNLVVTTGGFSQVVKAYIDYDNNSVFATSEQVMTSTGINGNYTHTGTFTVPLTATTCVPLRLRIMADRVSSPAISPCGPLQYGQTEDYAVTVESSDTVGISLTAGTNPSCPGTSLTFTAVTNSTASPTYIWAINGATQFIGNPYSTTLPADGDVVRVGMVVPASCGSTSNDTIYAYYNVSRAPNTNIVTTNNLISGNDTMCIGSAAILQASIINAANVTYQWKLNGINTGTGTDTLQILPINGDQVYCEITGNNACLNGTYSTDTIVFNMISDLIPTASITSTAFPICDGSPVTFQASVTGQGAAPTYSWYLNGSQVSLGTLSYTNTSLANGDLVSFQLISSEACAMTPLANSNTITAVVNPNLPVSVSTQFLQGSSTICEGESVQLLGNITNGGNAPVFTWLLNGNPFGNSNPMTFNALNDGDQIVLSGASSETCTSGNPAQSAPISMTVLNTPSDIQIFLIGNVLTSSFATGYQWFEGNGNPISGATSQTYTPTLNGSYYCLPINGPCIGNPSNLLEVYVLGTQWLTEKEVALYPNPAQSNTIVEWKSESVINQFYLYNALGQQITLQYSKIGNNQYELDLSNVSNGNYILKISGENNEVYFIKLEVFK